MKKKTLKPVTGKLPETKKEKKKRIFKFYKFREIKKEEIKESDSVLESFYRIRMILRNKLPFDV
jgi:hypothetical protein